MPCDRARYARVILRCPFQIIHAASARHTPRAARHARRSDVDAILMLLYYLSTPIIVSAEYLLFSFSVSFADVVYSHVMFSQTEGRRCLRHRSRRTGHEKYSYKK
jgi:hypothetical protein